jgi:HEAT repeat protein
VRHGTRGAASELLRALREQLVPAERIVEKLGTRWAAGTLIAGYRREENLAIRPWIIEALGLADVREASPVLIEASVRGAEEERIKAARALGRVSDLYVTDALIRLLTDPAGAVRAQAARALVAHPDARAAATLRGLLSDDEWWVRANAAEALRSLGDVGLAELTGALNDPNRAARDRAGEALALHKASTAALAA